MLYDFRFLVQQPHQFRDSISAARTTANATSVSGQLTSSDPTPIDRSEARRTKKSEV